MALTIELASGSEAEANTREWLRRLLEQYDVAGWMFTLRVRIEEDAVPHSHPVLTLGTRSPHDWALLSALIHEQLHWFLAGRWPERAATSASDSWVPDSAIGLMRRGGSPKRSP